MKRIIVTLLAISLVMAGASAKDMVYVDACDLTMIGRAYPGTPNPYHRVDTVVHKGFTPGENNQVRCSAGMAVLFRTDSPEINVMYTMGFQYSKVSTMAMSYRGFDLYVLKDGKWLWAGDGAMKEGHNGESVRIVSHMDGTLKTCLMYFPMYSEVLRAEIGVQEGSVLEPAENPFRHRIVFHGSSYTQGVSSSRPGMTYPSQFMRRTGLQVCNLATSGNSKLQPYMADMLAAVDADAFVFDTFSNPSAEEISERLIPFVEKMVAAHPDDPIIFQQTIYRESCNFNLSAREKWQASYEMAEKMMKDITRKYRNVYFIHPCATTDDHEFSVDGTHPDDYGYFLWEKSIEKPVLRILRKYGIR